MGRVSQFGGISAGGEGSADVVSGSANCKAGREAVFQASAHASGTGDVGRLFLAARVFPAQQPMKESADVAINVGMKNGTQED